MSWGHPRGYSEGGTFIAHPGDAYAFLESWGRGLRRGALAAAIDGLVVADAVMTSSPGRYCAEERDANRRAIEVLRSVRL